MSVRAVVFDLWDTLVLWPHELTPQLYERIGERVGVDPARVEELWVASAHERWVAPLLTPVRSVCREAGISEELAEAIIEIRSEHTRSVFVPREGALETLAELRRRGLALGLITNCSEDAEAAWEASDFAPLFEATVFSSAAGLMKPDPRIYELACSELGVPPAEAVFLGDGQNDELAGAVRAGMTAIRIRAPGESPSRGADWDGPTIDSLPDLLAFL